MAPTDRRNQILDAAQAVLLQRGLKAATVERMTTRAGIAKGTFYLYFDSRDALLQAIQDRLGGELLRDVEVALKRRNRVQAVADFVDAVVDFHARGGATAALIGHRPQERVGAAFARFVADGCKAGDFDVKDPAATAALLYASICTESGNSSDGVRAAAREMFRRTLLRKGRKK